MLGVPSPMCLQVLPQQGKVNDLHAQEHMHNERL